MVRLSFSGILKDLRDLFHGKVDRAPVNRTPLIKNRNALVLPYPPT